MTSEKSSQQSLADKLMFQPKNIWDTTTEEQIKTIYELGDKYKKFLSASKTERKLVDNLITTLKKNDFCDLSLNNFSNNQKGFLLHQNKLLGVYFPGELSPLEGFNILVAHGDSPRLDLKPRCVYEDLELGFLKTNLYGGLKKFQWLSRPLALWGHCVMQNGKHIEFQLGENPDEPVLTVADLLPHLDRDAQRNKKMSEAIAAEKLNLLAASIPLGSKEDKHRLKLAVLKILHDRWGLVEEDLISSEIEVVPAGQARDVGLDSSLVGGYGQDDRIAAFAAIEALLSLKGVPKKPTLILIYDREEIGSYGSTGASANFVEHLAAKAFEVSGLEPKWSLVNRALLLSNAFSADVEGAIDPDYKEVHEDLNAAKLSYGPCLVRYTGGSGKSGASEANAEFVAKIRKIFGDHKVLWQNSLLGKQEVGGGGTVALYLADYGLNIIDCGPALLGMHSPFEISSKADLWMTIKAYSAFYQMI